MSRQPEIRHERVYVEDVPGFRRRRKVIRNVDVEHRLGAYKVVQLIWLAFGVLDVLLVFRFALKLARANPNNAFARSVYNLSDLFLSPFVGLVSSPVSANGMVLEISTLVAIVVYSLIAWVLARLFWVLFYRPDSRVISTEEERDDR
jgi:YggT family protein